MSPTDGGSPRRAWMPDPARIVSEQELRPGRRMAAPAVAAPASRTYRILRTDEVDPYDTPLQSAEIPTLGMARFAGLGDSFEGTARKAAKLSITAAERETFADLRDLIDTLPAHKTMVEHTPKITTTASSNRVDKEKRNVRVQTFLYAASRENDNDYHLILGRDPELAPSLYMTMEISGLPPSSSTHFARLTAARDAYKGFFADDLPGASYDFYDPPIPVEVEGSLFFDMSHATGSRPGPSSLRPNMPTVWEIHPIAEIVFEP
jgi:hypothetical protein